MKSIKIVSDGTPDRTYFYDLNGFPLEGITSFTIEGSVGQLNTATITFVNAELEMIALWDEHPLKHWANKKTGKI